MNLQGFFTEHPKVALAFSGGVDSAYLLYAAMHCGAQVRAYYVNAAFQPQFELDDATRLANELHADMRVLTVDVLSDPTVAAATANTMAFATLTLCQLFHAYDVRSEHHSLFHIGILSNPAMNKAFLVGLGMQLAVLLFPPLQRIFQVVPLNGPEWAVVLALPITPVVIC